MGSAEQPHPLVEPFFVPSIFLSGIDVQQIENDCFHVYGYVVTRGHDGSEERQIVSKVVMTKPDLLASLYKCAKAMGWTLAGEIRFSETKTQTIPH